jgi:asparagine synthase (glutamine-hydrolysing)
LVASHLGIPINYFEWGNDSIDSHWEQTPLYTPEPISNLCELETHREYLRRAQSLGQVFLFGEGPDNALRFEWQRYGAFLIRERRYGRLAEDLFRSVVACNRPPFWDRARGILSKWRTGDAAKPAEFPVWIDKSLEARFQLRSRWKAGWDVSPQLSAHPLRPEAHASFNTALWQYIFEWFDPGRTSARFEVRHPYMDLSMLRFLMAVPAMPWCRAKYLLRRGMKDVLPAPVLRRHKGGISCAAIMKRSVRHQETPLLPVQQLLDYIDLARVPASSNGDAWDMGADLRLRSLNHWLRYSWKQRGTVAAGAAEPRNDAHLVSTTLT